MPITGLQLSNLDPFDEIAFEFDGQVNVFVGPNNSGKSTALWALAEIVVYPFGLPRKLRRDKPTTFKLTSLAGQASTVYEYLLPIFTSVSAEKNREKKKRSTQYVEMLSLAGFTSYIPALRHSSDFRSKGPVTQDKSRPDESPPWNGYPELAKRRGLMETTAALMSDEAVMGKIVELDYRAYRLLQPSIRELIEKIGSMASRICEGFNVRFVAVGEDKEGFSPEFDTPDGRVSLNVLSQGPQSIIQWLAHLLIGYAEYYDYPPNLEEKPGILIIDEIDVHLHPSWQRRIIPALTRNFPNLQIFCSTHSPLMLAGLEEGQAQLLSRDTKGHRRRVPQRGRYCGLVVRRDPAQHAGRGRSN